MAPDCTMSQGWQRTLCKEYVGQVALWHRGQPDEALPILFFIHQHKYLKK